MKAIRELIGEYQDNSIVEGIAKMLSSALSSEVETRNGGVIRNLGDMDKYD